MQPYFNPTKRNMEDDLNIFENGRRPPIFVKEDNLNFFFKGRRPEKNSATKNNQK
jgi:hypothetical protein